MHHLSAPGVGRDRRTRAFEARSGLFETATRIPPAAGWAGEEACPRGNREWKRRHTLPEKRYAQLK
jgi:hypothetical protein